MHSRGVLHRDIQLGNTVVGLAPNEKTLYMIDFGFSKRYVNAKSKKHIVNKKEPDFIGNYWFSSVNVHCRGRSALCRLVARDPQLLTRRAQLVRAAMIWRRSR
jgi:casein kinase 1